MTPVPKVFSPGQFASVSETVLRPWLLRLVSMWYFCFYWPTLWNTSAHISTTLPLVSGVAVSDEFMRLMRLIFSHAFCPRIGVVFSLVTYRP